MPQQTMFMSEFIRRVFGKIYDVCDAELHPTNSELRAQNILSITRQIRDRVPPWFLEEFLETTKNPERTVESAVRAFRETAHPFPSMVMPSESLRGCILEGAVPQVVHALVVEIFGPLIMVDQSGPQQLKFTNDIVGLYTFLVRKTTEEAVRTEGKGDQSQARQEHEGADDNTVNADSNHDDKGGDNGEICVALGDDDKKVLIQECSDSLFSISLLIKRLKRAEKQPGQYL